MSFNPDFNIKRLSPIEIKGSKIVKISSNRKDGRCYKLKLNDIESKEFSINDLFKTVQKISNNKDLDEKYAKFEALRGLIIRLKEADNKVSNAFSVHSVSNTASHSKTLDDLDLEIQQKLYSVLLQTVYSDDMKIVKSLLARNNIDVNLKSNVGLSNTVLSQIIYDEDVERTKFLLTETNIDVNLQNNAGDTALMFAVNKGNLEILKLLLQHPKINVTLNNHRGDTALKRAASKGNVEISKLLLEHPDIALMFAISNEDIAKIETLVKKENVDINLQDENGNTALIKAVVKKSKSLVELLLQNENIKLNLQDKLGRTAKMYASASGDKEIIEMLSKAITRQDLNIQKEMLKLILLAHSTNTGKTSQVKTKEIGTEYELVNLEGINYTYLLKKMSQAIEHFAKYPLQSVNQNESLQLSDIFKCSINNSNVEILDRIKKGLPVLLPTGYSGHSVSVLTWGPYFTLCNRGEGMREGVVEVFKCDPEKIDSEVLDKIRNSLNNNAEAYRKLFLEELPMKLNFKPKGSPELKLENICAKNLTQQMVGNCSWASPEGSVFTFFLFSTLLADANGQLTIDPISTMELIEPHSLEISQIRHKFNEWLVVTQMYELERYLGVDALRALSSEKVGRNAERRQGIEIDYSVLQSALQTILSNASKLSDSDDMIANLKSILAKTLALTTSGDEEQHQKTAQEILDSLSTLTSDELKAKFEN